MKQWLITICFALSLNACGYHLVGQGSSEGVIPADATQVMVLLVGGGNHAQLTTALQQALQADGQVLVQGKDAASDVVEIRIEQPQEVLQASSFDSSGVANQYHLSLSAAVRIIRSGKELWASEAIVVSGDVFASGDAVAIEAQKNKVLQSLRDEWVQKLMGRLRSGF